MDWCRLECGYYRDPAVVRAGEAAEVLFTRMMGYCAEHETGGVVPRAALPLLTPTKTKLRVDALIREGLVLDVGDDVVLRSWERIQEALDGESERRRKAREKKARQRREKKDTDSASPLLSSGRVPGTTGGQSRGRPRHIEVEVEEEQKTSSSVAADPPTTTAHRLVAELVPGPLPRQQRARLYEVIDQLVADNVPEARIRVALTDWTSRADVSPGLLPHLVPRDVLEEATPW